MKQDSKKMTIAAIKRLEGLTGKLHQLVDEDAYCTKILEIALAMQGHLKHIQGMVLESHLHTCGPKNFSSPKAKEIFITDVLKVIGLSQRS
ncbi:MAG TPA: metal-sensing transcriptional repressor [Candidatus Peribacteraceae bacterium]|nr:metal-sensing transcriptional repressor [Candidatus Peribacteraceae bacterium]